MFTIGAKPSRLFSSSFSRSVSRLFFSEASQKRHVLGSLPRPIHGNSFSGIYHQCCGISSTYQFRHVQRPFSTSSRSGARFRRSHYSEESIPPHSNWALLATIGVNVGVFFLWQIHGSQSLLMKSYFTVSVKNIEEGRWWTALTSMVSHSGFFHLFNNMLALHVFGTQVCRTIGSTRFLTLYVVGGAIASYFHLAYVKLFQEPKFGPAAAQMGALGASGSAMAVGAFYALLWPYQRLAIFGLIPVSAGTLVLGLAFIDLLFIGETDGVGHAAHLGGALWGLSFALVLRALSRRVI